MSTIIIEKGIPLPGKRSSGLTNTLRGMSPGDSFVLSATHRNSAFNCAKAAGVKIYTRRLEDGSMRVWRAS
jgi:hypothetical protein